MSSDSLALAGFGLAILTVAWLPLWLDRLPLTLPMFAVAIGYAVFLLTQNAAAPLHHPELAELMTQTVLIVAVMGTGLSIDRRFQWRLWGSTWRLLVIVMPLSVAALAALGVGLLGLPLAMAVLLAGILAPTDPVLASSVQVGPPGIGEQGETRFALTSEAGLNDGMALPFVTLGLLMLSHGRPSGAEIGQWLLVDVIAKTAAGAAIGFLVSWLLVRVNGWLPQRFRLSRSNDGVASVGLAFLTYSVAEEAHGYGFVAVFVAAITLRNLGNTIGFAQQMHESAGRIERLLAFLLLVLFGGAIASGVLSSVHWREIAFALLALLVVRPAATLIAFIGSHQPMPVRLAAGYFGIRGIGSLYYITYAVGFGSGDNPGELWGVVALTVLLSILLYGVTADPVMGWLDRRMGKIDRNAVRDLATADFPRDPPPQPREEPQRRT